MHNQQPDTIMAVESFALFNAQTQGRGIVVAAVDGNMAELVFVSLESWLADPLPSFANDARFTDWLISYDPTRQYVLIEGIRDGETMILQPFCLPYVIIEPTPLASAA